MKNLKKLLCGALSLTTAGKVSSWAWRRPD